MPLSNNTRSRLAAHALDTFTSSPEMGIQQEPVADQITDLLTNLLHLAHQEGWELNLLDCAQRAQMHFEAERDGDNP